jgi:group II intron reverse transcriptase/maturase
MGKINERCAGIDVEKRFLLCCALSGAAQEEPLSQTRRFDATVQDLVHLRDWLSAKSITYVVMESTGSYWVPIFNILEGHFTIVLANPEEVKNRKGHKTDRKDAEHLTDLLRLGSFDNLSHEWTVKFLEHRVADRRIIRLIQKWLKAGVSEDGQWSETSKGTPQGAVVSPLIANLYLHYCFDLWADVWRRKMAKGDVIIVRYADDLALGFQLRADAVRFLEDFKERLAKFGLELHPEKTRLIEFGRYAARDRKQRGAGKPETFTFLGFTHYCGRRHKTDTFTVWRITAKKRMVAKLKAIKVELRRRMHARPSEVGAWLRKVVNGYYQYHAVPGNLRQLSTFRQRINRLWYQVLARRSQRARKRWETLTPLFERWIPRPKVLHPYPQARFYHSSLIRAVCVNALVRICAGLCLESSCNPAS